MPSLALSLQTRCYFVLSIAALCNLKIVVQSVAAAQSLLALARFCVAEHIVCAMGHLSLTGQPPAYIAKHRSTIQYSRCVYRGFVCQFVSLQDGSD